MADEQQTQPAEDWQQKQKLAWDILHQMSSDYRIDPTRLKMSDTNPRAEGGQGAVVVGTLLPSDEPETSLPEQTVAVKMLKWDRENPENSTKFFKSFVNEISLMATLSHPHIIKFLGFVEDMQNGKVWIILPWEGNGDVREFLRSGEWDIPERISLIQDTAEGLEYLHTHEPPICHGDLKSLNILVNSSYRAVITDFGSARIKQAVKEENEEHQFTLHFQAEVDGGITPLSASIKPVFNPSTNELTLTGPMFSLRWTAPEVLDDGTQDLPSDMWAMGWICWEIVTGKFPFEELSGKAAIIMHTIKGEFEKTANSHLF